MKLSAVLIVKNESSCIEKCLESVKGADEITVVDTGSVDNTVELVKKFTDKVFTDYKWNDNFAEARNHAKNKATGDWILSIDADETLEPGGIEKIRKAIEGAGKYKTVNCTLVSSGRPDEHQFPRVFRKDVKWCGAIHNYLNISEDYNSDIRITYGYSEAHQKDPDRSFRILKKEVESNPKCIREKFYLAREYWYKKDWISATYWYEEYLKVAWWAPEWADAYLMLSRCYTNLGKYDKAKESCLQAIKINADFKEALEYMAELSGPKNRVRWLKFAELAQNEDVLFVKNPEKGSSYYDNLFTNNQDMSRYEEISKEVGRMVGGKKVLEIGCGLGQLIKYVPNYSGFDFSNKAIEIIGDGRTWVGNAYEKKNYRDADVYVALEVLEHLDDLKVVDNIPSGKQFIFSVPSFTDESHLRTYTENMVRNRFINIKVLDIKRFNWDNKWVAGGLNTDSYILLVNAMKL